MGPPPEDRMKPTPATSSDLIEINGESCPEFLKIK